MLRGEILRKNSVNFFTESRLLVALIFGLNQLKFRQKRRYYQCRSLFNSII